MAKKKATSNRSGKKTTKKTGASSGGTRKTSKKKVSAASSRSKSKKSSTTRKKKKTAAKKTSTRKKATAKKVVKRSTSKKSAAGKKTTTRKKTASKAPSASANKTAKKPATKSAATGTSKKKSTAAVTTKKKSSKKKKSSGGKSSTSKIKGRSVAEVASSAETDDQGYVLINGRRVRMLSMKGVDRTKKKKTTSVAAAEITAAELPPSQRKTKLPKKDLRYYQGLLLERRRDIVGNLGSMENEALRSNGGEISHMPIHMADIGSETYEQDFMLGLAEGERTRLKEIDRALARIAEGTYGMCMMTGKEIPRARLEAKPWARYTIEAAREMERTGYSS